MFLKSLTNKTCKSSFSSLCKQFVRHCLYVFNSHNIFVSHQALEYAKTIAKPKAPQQLKERPKDETESEGGFEHSAYLQLGVDLTQLSTLEMLRKRHEQEKQVVARFTSIHSSSSAPSVSSH